MSQSGRNNTSRDAPPWYRFIGLVVKEAVRRVRLQQGDERQREPAIRPDELGGTKSDDTALRSDGA